VRDSVGILFILFSTQQSSMKYHPIYAIRFVAGERYINKSLTTPLFPWFLCFQVYGIGW